MATVIISKRNIIIPSPDGRQAYPIPKDYIGSVPDWVTKTKYFKELVKDGKIAVSSTTKDNALNRQMQKRKRQNRKPEKKPKPPLKQKRQNWKLLKSLKKQKNLRERRNEVMRDVLYETTVFGYQSRCV
ncbi:MAG: hypothetical protein V8Q36_03495 [Anaerotignum sp.]